MIRSGLRGCRPRLPSTTLDAHASIAHPATAGDLAPISGSKQPARKRPGPDAPNGRWQLFASTPPRAGQPPACRRKRRRVMSTRELHARANGFELHGRRSPRDGRLTRAARQCACARSLSTQSFRPAAPSVLAARQLSGSRRQSGVRRPICTWWAIHAVAARRPRATGSVCGMMHELASDAASGRIGRR